MQTRKPISKTNSMLVGQTEKLVNETNLVERLELLALTLPDAIALVDDEETYTYRALNEKANQLAYYLRGIGLTGLSRAAICLGQSAQRIITFLAVWKTGAAYVPIDGGLPESRIKLMVEDAGVDIMLAEQHFWTKVNGLARVTVLLDQLPPAIKLSKLPSENLAARLAPASCAYIIFTSGSSGRPKGVVISHASLFHFTMQQAQVLALNAKSRTLQFASPSFDAAVIDSWVPLSQGATVVLYPDNKIVGEPLLDFILAKNIDTVPLLPPAVLASLPHNRPIGSLQTLAIGGEAATENTISHWYKRLRLINSYGPTEATVAVSNYHFTDEPNPRIIGSALPGNRLYVLDAAGQEVPIGGVGELFIGGPQLALGYVNRKEETARAFTNRPAHLPAEKGDSDRLYRTGDRVKRRQDSLLEYIGREDEQVKIRGYRIELAEVEHNLAKLPQIARAAVKVNRPEQGMPSLVAFVQPFANGNMGSLTDIKTKLQQLMPAYMVPDKVIALTSLPLNHAGKVDKEQLQLPQTEEHMPKPKRVYANLQLQMQEIWKEVLGLDDVPLDADFFDLGGHSLMLAKLHVQLPEPVRVRIALPELYTYTTIRTFVEEVEKRLRAVDVSQKIKAQQLTEELMEDSELPFDFTIGAVPNASILANPQHIFLTGATGFVGSHLLEELLQHHPNATIHCLVRADTVADAWGRIAATFAKFKLPWEKQKMARVLLYTGDLSLPHFGMADAVYENLMQIIDVIYHSGSSVSYVQPYTMIKKPNIDGLHHILHLAVNRKVKYLVLLSSMGVFSWGRPFTGKTWMYEDDLIEQNLPAVARDLGYIKSKWVMENMASKAKAKGLPIINFRLGFAVCHSTSGATVKNQWWGALMRTCATLKSFPLVMGLKDELTTVDYMCKAIAHIAKKTEAVGQNFHLSPLPENDVSLTDFCAKMNEYFDLKLEGMEYHQWLDQWRYKAELPIYPLLSLFTEDVHEGKCLVEAYENTYYYDRTNTQRLLADANLKPPAFDKEVMLPYLQFLGIL